jgi:hypothetical protein
MVPVRTVRACQLDDIHHISGLEETRRPTARAIRHSTERCSETVATAPGSPGGT